MRAARVVILGRAGLAGFGDARELIGTGLHADLDLPRFPGVRTASVCVLDSNRVRATNRIGPAAKRVMLGVTSTR